MNLRHFMSWKPLFYGGILPALRRLGPARCDAVLGFIGRLFLLWPWRRRELTRALKRGREVFRAEWKPRTLRSALAGNAVRFLARDYTLDGLSDAEALARFDVDGFSALEARLKQEQGGAILVGCHLGGHIAAMHWLFRRGVPLRLLVQRPRHVSTWLDQRFDRDEPHPQSAFFLRRDLGPHAATERLLRARSALRDGCAVYLAGDIPWIGANSRPGSLLGQRQMFLSVWADLAAVTGAPVFFVFCTHRHGGRYALELDPPCTVRPGEELAAVTNYLSRLEARIAAHPADSVAHLLWPCYGPPRLSSPLIKRPSRRVATAI